MKQYYICIVLVDGVSSFELIDIDLWDNVQHRIVFHPAENESEHPIVGGFGDDNVDIAFASFMNNLSEFVTKKFIKRDPHNESDEYLICLCSFISDNHELMWRLSHG